jgi:hypothetical protein
VPDISNHLEQRIPPCAWPGCGLEALVWAEYVQPGPTGELRLSWLKRDGVVALCTGHVEELEGFGTRIVSLRPIAPE